KFAFVGSRCEACGARHVPPQRVCVKCHAVDRMAAERMADVPATIATYTVDRLAYSLSPPVVAAVIDFEGGGRFQCELTDVDPAAVKIGDRVEMTFRRLFTAGGVPNYFWKARPLRGREGLGGTRRRHHVARDAGTHDARRQIVIGSGPAKRQQGFLGLPLLVDVDAGGVDRVGGHDEVAAAVRLARLHHRLERRRQEIEPRARAYVDLSRD